MAHSRSRVLCLWYLTSVLILPGCWFAEQTEHYPSSTIATGFSGDFWHLKPNAGNGEVFVVRQTSQTILPPFVGRQYAFVDIRPSLLLENSTLVVPSEGVDAIACQEVHPGYWCANAEGMVTVLRVSPDWVELQIDLKAEAKSQGMTKKLIRGLAFKRSE